MIINGRNGAKFLMTFRRLILSFLSKSWNISTVYIVQDIILYRTKWLKCMCHSILIQFYYCLYRISSSVNKKIAISDNVVSKVKRLTLFTFGALVQWSLYDLLLFCELASSSISYFMQWDIMKFKFYRQRL